MEVYILDRLLRRIDLIDRFESFIWTERWRAFGDFELVVVSTPMSRKKFTVNTLLAMNHSHRVMMVETVENSLDAEGRAMLTVKGPSMEMWMEDRLIAAGANGSEGNKITFDLPPAAIARNLFGMVAIDGLYSVHDKLPFYTPGSIFPAENLLEPAAAVFHEVDTTTLYDAIKDICDTYGLGFRIVRNQDESQLMFNIYTGIDRTRNQTIYDAVVFSEKLGNLENITHYTTTAEAKNVCYVYAKNGRAIVYADGVNTNIAGFDRKVMHLKAEGLDELPAGTDLTNKLIHQGKAALAKAKGIQAFDGEVPQRSNYIYGYHYNLGDLVEMQSTDGAMNYMRVEEQIFVSDSEGERSYPTLATELFIEAGTWLAWDDTMTWSQADFPWIDAI